MTVPQPSLGDKPSRMPPADLGSAFSGKSRSDGLGGRLAPMKLAPTLPVQLPQAPEVSTPEPKAARAITPRPVKAPAAPAVRSDASSGLQPIVVYVSASIRERLRNGAGEWTFTDIVLMALDATHANLQTRFVEQPAPGKSMFAGRGRATTRRHTEPHVQISLRPLRDDLAVIDRLSSELNAPSRSALINAALDEYLPRDQ
jgi:hypothetical protein